MQHVENLRRGSYVLITLVNTDARGVTVTASAQNMFYGSEEVASNIGANMVDMTEYLQSWRKEREEMEGNERHTIDTHKRCMKVQASGKSGNSRCLSQGDCDRTYLYSYSFVRHQTFATS